MDGIVLYSVHNCALSGSALHKVLGGDLLQQKTGGPKNGRAALLNVVVVALVPTFRIHFAVARQWDRLLNGIIEGLKSRSVDQQVGRRTLSICNSPHKIGQNFTQEEEHRVEGK